MNGRVGSSNQIKSILQVSYLYFVSEILIGHCRYFSVPLEEECEASHLYSVLLDMCQGWQHIPFHLDKCTVSGLKAKNLRPLINFLTISVLIYKYRNQFCVRCLFDFYNFLRKGLHLAKDRLQYQISDGAKLLEGIVEAQR